MYITIEGIDTAGKSTQIALLQKKFSKAIVTKEPGATQAGAKIRSIILDDGLHSSKAEFLMFLADRAEHLEQIIKPNLNELIISDRSVISGIAYALIKKDISQTAILHMNRFATDGIYPDKVFILKLSKKELEFRLSQKEHDKIEKRGSEYLLGIQEALINACELLDIEAIMIDASESIETIHTKIISYM